MKKKKGKIKFTATLLKTDVPDANGNIFPREVVETSLKNMESEKLIGKIGFRGQISFSHEPSHVAENLRLEDNQLVADIHPLSNEPGNLLRKCLKDCDFVASGAGTVVEKDGIKIVKSFDLMYVTAIRKENGKNENQEEKTPPKADS
jgi:hypothetical protein